MGNRRKYKPKHAKGQILVCFKLEKDCSKEFARIFGGFIGYVLSDEDYDRGGNVFIYKTEKGEEREACKQFLKYGDFVDWASLRDSKMEVRWDRADRVLTMAQSLYDDAGLPDDEYAEEIEKIINYLEELKKEGRDDNSR